MMRFDHQSGLFLPRSRRELEERRLLEGSSHQAMLAIAAATALSTWNPSDKDSDVTLSGSNLIATLVATGSELGGVRGTKLRPSTDNAYFEVTQTTDQNGLAGIGRAGALITSYPGGSSGGYGSYQYANQSYADGSANSGQYISQSAVGVLYDPSNGKITFITPVSLILAESFTITAGTSLAPMWAQGSGAGSRSGTINTGGSAFVYGLPPGATAWGGTWNSADKGGAITLSGSDLVASSVNSLDAVRGTQFRSSGGPWYFEVTYSDTICLMGLGNSSASLSNYPGSNSNSWGYYRDADLKYNSGSGASMPSGRISPVTTGVWMNNGALKYIVYPGVTGPTANTITAGDYFPMWGAGTAASGTRTGTLNVGGSAFVYSPPSGASAWG
jgi:hypothetical protein